ncbi:hypothetical protein SEA_MAGNITO_89 [Mycobacterium phage Magnito]|nr:hypothetical protein SEA_MAGNITO_89 [Mycobacterium phage Magnito]
MIRNEENPMSYFTINAITVAEFGGTTVREPRARYNDRAEALAAAIDLGQEIAGPCSRGLPSSDCRGGSRRGSRSGGPGGQRGLGCRVHRDRPGRASAGRGCAAPRRHRLHQVRGVMTMSAWNRTEDGYRHSTGRWYAIETGEDAYDLFTGPVDNPLGWRFVLDGDLAAVREHVDSRG